jgi:hypothetical protein
MSTGANTFHKTPCQWLFTPRRTCACCCSCWPQWVVAQLQQREATPLGPAAVYAPCQDAPSHDTNPFFHKTPWPWLERTCDGCCSCGPQWVVAQLLHPFKKRQHDSQNTMAFKQVFLSHPGAFVMVAAPAGPSRLAKPLHHASTQKILTPDC